MTKKLIIGGIILAVLLALSLPFLIFIQQTALTEGYSTYDDFSVPTPALTKGSGEDSLWKINDGGNCRYEYRDGDLIISWAGDSPNPCSGTLTTAKNLKGYDFKTIYRAVTTSGSGSGSEISTSIFLNGISVADFGVTKYKRQPDIDKTMFVEILQNKAIKGNYDIIVNGQESISFSLKDENISVRYGYRLVQGNMVIKQLDYRPFFNCEVQPDEVVIKDEFIGPQQITIGDLSYIPLKFCTDSFPVIIRDIEKGLTPDLRGDITRLLARGEKISIKEGQTYTVGYIADYNRGLMDKCLPGKAWNGKKCEQYVFEEADFIPVIRDVQFIEVGIGEISFINSLMIADKKLDTSTPQFICQNDINLGDSETAPRPREECWKIPLSYAGSTVLARYNEEISLDKYFAIKLFTDATYKNGKIESGFINKGILKLKDLSFLEVKPKEESKYYVFKDSSSQICWNIDNKLGAFDGGGARIKIKNKLLNQEETIFTSFKVPSGLKEYCFIQNTQQLGQFEYIINPYVVIGEKQIFDDQAFVYTSEIVTSIPEDKILVNTTLEDREIQLKQETKQLAYLLIPLLVLVVIILVVVRRKSLG